MSASDVSSFDPDTNTIPDSRAYVNGTRIPISDVDIHIRNEGPVDLTRYAEVEFASPWEGVDYAKTFQGLDPAEQDEWDTLRIEIRDRSTGEYHTEFHGFVTGVGNNANPNERMWLARAQGPGQWANKTPVEITVGGRGLKEVLRQLGGEFESLYPMDLTLRSPVAETEAGSGLETYEPIDGHEVAEYGPLSDPVKDPTYNPITNTPKQFRSTKDTLADVLGWMGRKVGLYTWFEPTREGAALFVTPRPTERVHNAQYLGGDLLIKNNDALTELKPVNTALLRGDAQRSLEETDDLDLAVSKGTSYSVKAYHTKLLERAGGRHYYGEPEMISDGASTEGIVNEAKKRLKEMITGATGGDMETLLRSPIRPFDTVRAKPTCDSSPATNVPAIKYEVTRVHHHIRPDSGSEMDTGTTLNVGKRAAKEDIEVETGWVEE